MNIGLSLRSSLKFGLQIYKYTQWSLIEIKNRQQSLFRDR